MSMDTGTPSPLRPRQLISPSIRVLFITWVGVMMAGYVLYNLSGNWRTGRIRNRQRAVETATSTELRVADDSRSPEPNVEQRATPTVNRSDLAVQRMKLAEHQVRIQSARKQLAQIKQLQANWNTQQERLLRGDPGKRIAADPTQLSLVADLLEESRADDTSLTTWELQLKELATPVEQALADARSGLELSVEHQQMLNNLGEQIQTALQQAERSALVLRGIENATAHLTPVSRTLADVLRDRKAERERATAERLAEAKEAARVAAEKEQADKVAQLERELAEAKGRVKEVELKAEAARVANMAQLEQERQAEVARLESAAKQAEITEAREAADHLAAQKARERLNREFERDMPQVLSYLRAFTSDGFKHRPDETKGPSSWSYLQSQGVLKEGLPGLQRFLFLGAADNDRPRGALPYYIGGNLQGVQGLNIEPVEKAQALLRKYGELMVERRMLAP